MRTVILECVHGSRAYGLATPESDTDKKGIFVGGREVHFGYRPWPEQVELSPDHVLYDIRKFFSLAVNSNPTVIEILFTDESDRLTVTEEGALLLAHGRDFLSRRAGDSFGRYGLSQLQRIKTHRRWLLEPPRTRPERKAFGLPERAPIPKDQLGAAEALLRDGRLEEAELTPNFLELMDRERRYRAASAEWKQYNEWLTKRNPARAELERSHGYDTKHAMHLVRLLRMAHEILKTGEVRVRRPDAEELRAIRRGALSFEELLTQSEAMGRELPALAAASPLPVTPDENAIDALCSEIVARVLARPADSKENPR